MLMNFNFLTLILSLITTTRGITSTLFEESLHLHQFQDGKVSAKFLFKTSLSQNNLESNNFDVLPKTIGELIAKFNVQEMHLSFTQGRWKNDRWGWGQDRLAVPPGALLLAWIQDESQFNALTNALAGLFCSSLNFMRKSSTSSPHHAFKSSAPNLTLNSTFLYSHLPRENVCTENLTPWARLLPCKTKAGLASLLNGYKLFDGAYQSMAIHWTPKRTDDGQVYYEFTQSVMAVLDPVRTTRSKDWSFQSLMGGSIRRTCPMASKSDIFITSDFTVNETPLLIPPTSSTIEKDGIIYFDAKSAAAATSPLDIQVRWPTLLLNNKNPNSASVLTHRYLGGSGQERGSIKVELHNRNPHSINTTYFESIPWILKIYLHTLDIKTNRDSCHIVTLDAILRKTLYTLSQDRERPTIIELDLTLPPLSTVYISIDYECAFVKVNEHYPDANHGFDIGTAALLLPNGQNLYMESLLIRLPTPDFSMPYNCIQHAYSQMGSDRAVIMSLRAKSIQNMAHLPDITELNKCSEIEFKRAIDTLFELSPPLVKSLSSQRISGTFTSYIDLIEKATICIHEMTREEKVETVNAHPRIGAPTQSLSILSNKEQGGVHEEGLEETLKKLALLNQKYEEKFGFKFVVFVNGRSRREIVKVLEERLESGTREGELQVGLDAMVSIAFDRLKKIQISSKI